MFLQLVEQRHRLLLRKMDAQFLHDVVVIGAYAAELGMKVGQLGTVFQHCFVHFMYPELLSEEMRLQKDGFRIHL